MNHVASSGFLHFLFADLKALPELLHRFAVKLLRCDPWALSSEGDMAFSDKRVRVKRIAAFWPPPTLGDVHGDHLAEHVVLSVIGGNVLGLSPDYRADLDFPVGAFAAARNDHRFRIADHGYSAGFHE